MHFGNVMESDGLELKAVVLVAATWFCLTAVLLSGMR
jgi:hypothetical protein